MPQAQNHAYEKAIKAYDEVLKAQPGNVAAKTNRAIVARRAEEAGGGAAAAGAGRSSRRTCRPTRRKSIRTRRAASA